MWLTANANIVEPALGPQKAAESWQLRWGPSHAEEVYACEFLGAGGGGGGGEHLCTASADSLFLWDLQSGRLLQRCAGAVAGKRDTAGTAVGQQSSAVRLLG